MLVDVFNKDLLNVYKIREINTGLLVRLPNGSGNLLLK